MKAFDGPSLSPADVKDLFWRNFRVKLSAAEAEAMIVNFRKKVVYKTVVPIVVGCVSVLFWVCFIYQLWGRIIVYMGARFSIRAPSTIEGSLTTKQPNEAVALVRP